MKSPLKTLREECDLTIERVAARTDLSKQFIIKAEQAVYQELPERLVSFYAGETSVNYVELAADYAEFQREVRLGNFGRLIEPWTFQFATHPFKHWREMSGVGSLSGLCRMFCVHPAVMSKFENQTYLLNAVPAQLVTALLESGYSEETLRALQLAYDGYRAMIREGVTLVK